MKLVKYLSLWAVTLLLSFAAQLLRAQAPPDNNWIFPIPLDSFSFRDVTNWTSDTGIAPLSFTNIVGVRKGDLDTDYALLVDSTNLAWLTFTLTNQTATNLVLVPGGSLTFWVDPADWASASTNGAGPGTWGELLSVGQWTTNASTGYWGLSIASNGNDLYFAAQTNGGDGVTATYLTAPISWNTNEWHFIGLTWTQTNSALYVDGDLVTNGLGVTVLPGPSVTNMYLGSDSFGFSQSRCFLDDIYIFAGNLGSNDFENIYYTQYSEYIINPYNSALYFADAADTNGLDTDLGLSVITISNSVATLLAMNSSPDVLYEIQSKTNLLQPTWNSEGFVYGSELTNWTAANVPENGRPSLFMRLRSWQDSTGTGIPDWWWLQYFDRITNVNAYASAAGDGYSNLQKFQMGLNPTNYYNTNPPPGFFGAVVNNTNAVLVWSPSPGPIANYLVQRGILDTNSSTYHYTSFVLSSNATSFQDAGVITNDNAQNNIYDLEALYVGGCLTATDTWSVANDQQGSFGPPYGPPVASNVWAYPDATGTNLLISWTPAQGSPTNYIIERGILDTNTYNYDYYPVAEAGMNTNLFAVFGEFSDPTNWENLYAVVAEFSSGILSAPAVSGINAGPPTGPNAPTGLYGYMDSTGTNAWLNWNPSSNAVGYVIYHGTFNYSIGPVPFPYAYPEGAYSYMEVAAVGAGTNSFEVVGANDASHDYSSDVYTVVAVYSGGVLSVAAGPWQVGTGSAPPGTLYAYLDSTGTNVLLAWNAPNSGVTGYNLSRSGDFGTSYLPIAQVSSAVATYEDTNGVAAGNSGAPSLVYEIEATYPHGGVSTAITATVVSSPPAPSGLTANVDSTGTNIVLSWQPAIGSVSQYVIERGTYDPNTGNYSYTQIGTVSASSGITSFTDYGAFTGGNTANDAYEVLADDTDGEISDPDSSYVNSPAPTQTSNLNITAQLIRNEQGRWELMFSQIPTNVQAVALYWYDFYYLQSSLNNLGEPYSAEKDIPVTNITNGIYALSDYDATNWFANNGSGKVAMIQPIGPGNVYGKLVQAGFESYDSPVFVDARLHMKQNLLHELRAATLTQRNILLQEYNVANSPLGANIDVLLTNTDYAESSIFHLSYMALGYYEYLKMDNLWPVTVNYQCHQVLFDTNHTIPWTFDWQPQPDLSFLSFQGPMTSDPAPPVLGIGDPYWTQLPLTFSNNVASVPDMPIDSVDGSIYFETSAKNTFGLSFDTALVSNGDSFPWATLAPGDSIAISNINCFYSQTVDPGLVLTNYYFAPVITPGTALVGGPPFVEPYPLPCLDGFSNTNETPVIIGSVGTPMVIGGWAKFAITNGDPTKFAYLGQYFDTNAILFTNGSPAPDSPGVISPYGEFFPTEPGVALLQTMPDIDTEDIGFAGVRVISLNVDANHDGTMDFTYKGPDFVSSYKPFRFWVNDNQDYGDYTGSGIPGQGGSGDGVMKIRPPAVAPYLTPYYPVGWYVHGRRDLLDFFPVAVNIGSLFESNVVSARIDPADTNWQYVLSQADGALRYAFTDLTPTNYMSFLRDTNESGNLAFAPLYTITSNGVPLPSSFASSVASSNLNIILVEAWENTTNPLILTIYHGTNQIAQTELPLSITGVEQMYRQKTILIKSDPRAQLDRLTDTNVPNEPETIDKNFVFIHGYNVNPDQARGNFADIFKRLYWSGSHAKFYGVNWWGCESQGGLGLPDTSDVTANYHTNVANAFLTAPLLANFLATLGNGETVVAAHSLANMVVLSALNDCTNVNFSVSKFFMIDAAVALEAIDGGVPENTNLVDLDWLDYTNRLYASKWFQTFGVDDGRNKLNWNNRFQNLPLADIYNFYSSGEQVLREYTGGDPPPDLLSSVPSQVSALLKGAQGDFTWVWQERAKGISESDDFLGSTHGGWGFNPDYDNIFGTHLDAADAANLSNVQLQTNAFFNIAPAASDYAYDDALELTNGSAYATANRNRLLAEAIPSLTLPVGANPIPVLNVFQQNFDMQTLYQNNWPLGRMIESETNNWHHSDVRVIAYTFTYKLFDEFVGIGNLR